MPSVRRSIFGLVADKNFTGILVLKLNPAAQVTCHAGVNKFTNDSTAAEQRSS
jgi:hypothetical protein